MQRPTLEILFYGENIAAYEPGSDNLTITRVDKTDNPNYLFLTIDTRQRAAGTAAPARYR